MSFVCDRCDVPMLEKHEVLYRQCLCMKSGYKPVGDEPRTNMILIPHPYEDGRVKRALKRADPGPFERGLDRAVRGLPPEPRVLVRSAHQNVLLALPTDPAERKGAPITSGVLDYFPAACTEVAKVSKAGNDQHNPGQPLHWARGKSSDHADCIARHLMERGSVDVDGMRHSAKLAWRALALLQEELEAEAGFNPQENK